MNFKLFTSSCLTICLIVASGIQAAEATKATNTFNQQNHTRNVAIDRISASLETGDRPETGFSKTPSKSDVTKIYKVSSGNKLQRQNLQPIVIVSQCKSPCKTEI
ncbi:hypothetical protein [Scytonema sp. NUACC26]|uniref:hypothetical protein n=1 Tax=Scytonema sp. NUACC26 TaxID=3140176 RepID=UPI0034DBF477